jgi:hypothetical protein
MKWIGGLLAMLALAAGLVIAPHRAGADFGPFHGCPSVNYPSASTN